MRPVIFYSLIIIQQLKVAVKMFFDLFEF